MGSRTASELDFANGLLRRSLETTLILATMLALVISILAPTQSALAQEPKEASETAGNAVPAGFKRMRVRTIDSQGKPVAETRIYVAIWPDGTHKTLKRDYLTDEDGQALVLVPEPPRLFRVWTQRDGYVPLFAQWWPEKQPDGHLIPKQFTFSLPDGTSVGGVVTDEMGRPIKDVTVEVMLVSRDSGMGRRPIPSIWLAEVPGPGKNPCITNAEGRWNLNNVPAGDKIQVSAKLTHPNYISDQNWGGLQGEQQVTMQSFRDQTAKIKMHLGPVLTGKLTDPEGNPVADAVVVWADDPYLQTGSQETRTDEHGVYRSPPLPTGATQVTVVAEGWMPQRRATNIRSDIEPLDFQLQPGRTIRLKFVDSLGKPVPDVGVSIAEWRNSKSLYNHRHPDVLDTKIPRAADQNGVFEWTWAPDDAVTYAFWKEGYQSIQQKALPPGDHQIALVRVVVIQGTVTDASTGKPISSFRITPAYGKPVPELRDFAAINGGGGKYRYAFEDSSFFYYLVFEAEGYESLQSPPFSDSSEVIEFDVKLQENSD